jgi:hypothetical protein
MVALALAATTLTGLSMPTYAQQGESAPACPAEQALVKVLPGVDPAEVVARHGGTILKTIAGIDVQVVAVPAGTLSQKLDEFNADPDVKYAEADGVVQATANSDDQQCPPSDVPGI